MGWDSPPPLRTTLLWKVFSYLSSLNRIYVCTVNAITYCRGGADLFLACKDFGRMFSHSFPACALLFFFVVVEISSRTLISLLRPGSVHSGSVSWDDCGRVFPDELRVSSFSDMFPYHARTVAKSAHSDFIGSVVYACLGVTWHLHFLQNVRGLLRATAVARGWNGHRVRVSTYGRIGRLS